MDPEIIILNEARQRQISYDVAYMWSKKYANELICKQKQTHRHRKQTYGPQKGWWGAGIDCELGINSYTLLYILIN